MTMEVLIRDALRPLVAGGVHWNVAPHDAIAPRFVCQQVGGKGLNYVDDAVPDKQNARIQVAAWAGTPAEAKSLILQAETALILAEGLQCETLGAAIGTYEPDTKLHGARQDFSIWGAR
ncbi:DUF3168 domain-containing protein [Paracidovorax wautersii]|uniref:DUF3168 domain-containing protein n=1 Tax=Paracidovorax wautersii TaxID=1177982 RepID=A0ABU1IG13_9BURK|nr:DUF3168 domain-containing protein [Paracidovorax wautersii]MDR6216172.1 hypothetical protein [Paracidovorax wautersii]